MLCLSDFELYSCWVPLISLLGLGTKRLYFSFLRLCEYTMKEYRSEELLEYGWGRICAMSVLLVALNIRNTVTTEIPSRVTDYKY